VPAHGRERDSSRPPDTLPLAMIGNPARPAAAHERTPDSLGHPRDPATAWHSARPARLDSRPW